VSLKDANGNPVANAALMVTANAASGTILINAETSSSTGAGQASASVTSSTTGAANFTVTTNTVGPVTVVVSYAGSTLHTFTLNFTASHTSSTLPAKPTVSSLVALVGGFRLIVAASTTPVSSYQYSVNGGATWVSFSAVTRSVAVSNLLKSHTYVVYVRARNAVGVGPASSPRRVTTLK
jgi:titin